MPAYDPAKHHDPDVMLKWLARYAAGEDLRSCRPTRSIAGQPDPAPRFARAA